MATIVSRCSSLALALVLCCGNRSIAADFEVIREQIREARIEHSIPSIAVAVARGQRIVWEEGFGWADRENRIPATEHTTYCVASTSKPITATAIMLLCERGLLDLDRPINEYLGDVKIRARLGDVSEATVRRVLSHTSGLPQHIETYYPDETGQAGVDLTLQRYAYLMIPPGERFHYSNLGYAALGVVIERVSEKSFARFVREELFLPLRMNRSAVTLTAALKKHRAIRYREILYRSNTLRTPDFSSPPSWRLGYLRQCPRPRRLRHVSLERSAPSAPEASVRRDNRNDAAGRGTNGPGSLWPRVARYDGQEWPPYC